jgi:hypothetical protein
VHTSFSLKKYFNKTLGQWREMKSNDLNPHPFGAGVFSRQSRDLDQPFIDSTSVRPEDKKTVENI